MNTLDKSSEEKRQVPPIIQKILQLDAKVTNSFVSATYDVTWLRTLRIHAKSLEWSCHGVFIISAWLSFIWLVNVPSLYQTQVNLLLGLLLDIVIIAVLKALVRRRRPKPTTGMMAIGSDKFSFPSGHASRAMLMAYFFAYLDPISVFLIPPLFAWVGAICLSRVLAQRHYILDVVSGILVGLAEAMFLGLIWFSQSTSAGLLSWITDEKLEGGEYHV